MKLDRIDYNGGEIWVDKSIPIKEVKVEELCYELEKNDILPLHKTFSSNTVWKVVAQSITNPSYIDGVPFVEVEEDVEKLAFVEGLKEYPHRDVNNDLALGGFIRGYKAAQAKQFTEADIVRVGRHLVDMMLHKRSFLVEAEVKEYIQMFIQPKVVNIEIEMTKEARFEKNPDFHGTGYTNPGGFFDVLKTYQKDGKTFLTVTKINYATT